MKKLVFSLMLMSALALNAQDAPKDSGPKDGPKQAGPGEGAPRPGGPESGRRMEMRGTAGTITAIEGTTLTIKTIQGGTATIKTTEATRFNKDRQPAKLADFKVGDMIMVRADQPAEDNTYTAQAVFGGQPGGQPGQGQGGGMMQMMAEGLGKQFIVGKVEKIDELRLTIARPDGQTQEIEVNETTSFRKQGESITLADIKVGDQVFGRGAVKNGIFVPATLNVGMPGGMRMMMGPGGQTQNAPAPAKQPDHK